MVDVIRATGRPTTAPTDSAASAVMQIAVPTHHEQIASSAPPRRRSARRRRQAGERQERGAVRASRPSRSSEARIAA